MWPSRPMVFHLSVGYLIFICFRTHLVNFFDSVEVILSYSSYIQCLNTEFLSKLQWNEWVSYTDLTYLHNVYEIVSRHSLSFTVLHRIFTESNMFSKSDFILKISCTRGALIVLLEIKACLLESCNYLTSKSMEQWITLLSDLPPKLATPSLIIIMALVLPCVGQPKSLVDLTGAHLI